MVPSGFYGGFLSVCACFQGPYSGSIRIEGSGFDKDLAGVPEGTFEGSTRSAAVEQNGNAAERPMRQR